jgi:hypothetical protein
VRRAALALVGAVLGQSRDAAAQVRWDAELEEGVERRVLAARPAGLGDAGFGPTLDAAAHVALLPLVRVGLYAHWDTSPISGQDTRDLYAGGLDVRVGFPWLRREVRAYLRAGLGEAGVVAAARGGSSFVASSGGDFTEVPLAVGFLYRAEPHLSVTVELGARLGFAFGGTAYGATSSGEDVVAAALDLGVAWGR